MTIYNLVRERAGSVTTERQKAVGRNGGTVQENYENKESHTAATFQWAAVDLPPLCYALNTPSATYYEHQNTPYRNCERQIIFFLFKFYIIKPNSKTDRTRYYDKFCLH
jgi:hypothetical protein